MAFAITGSRGQVRHRLHPKHVRGPSGYRGSTTVTPKVKVERTHTVKPAAERKGLMSRVASKVKGILGRGNR